MTPLAQYRALRLSHCGRYVVTNDAHPYLYTISEALAWQRRAEADGARYEADADRFEAQGRTFDADLARGMASINLTTAAELAEVLAGAQMERAA